MVSLTIENKISFKKLPKKGKRRSEFEKVSIVISRQVLASLAQIANELDSKGFLVEADTLDKCMQRLSQFGEFDGGYTDDGYEGGYDGSTEARESDLMDAAEMRGDMERDMEMQEYAKMRRWFNEHAVSTREDGLRAQLGRDGISEGQFFQMAMDVYKASPGMFASPIEALRDLCNQYARKGREFGRGSVHPVPHRFPR